MATYNWYFSQSGNDSTGDGSSGNPWKTLAKAKTEIAAIDITDTAHLFFNRGDTWNFDTGQDSNFAVETYDPVVNMGAYGSGNKPVFDGNVAGGDFSTVPDNGVGGYNVTTAAFVFRKQNCSMKYAEIQNIYGVAVRGVSGFTFSGNHVHNIGYSGIDKPWTTAVTDILIEKNKFNTLMEMYREAKTPSWAGGINIYCDGSSCADWYDNIIRYNVVYDVYGEGIQGGNAIIEYNIVGDTGSIGIYPVPSSEDAHDTIVRYNLVVMSNSPTYKTFAGSSYKGIEIRDENVAGSNSNATMEVYGNIVINRKYGIMFDDHWGGSAFGEIRFFNNTVIDCDTANFVIGTGYNMVAPGKGFWYNNTSILYDRPGSKHAVDWGNIGNLSTYWTIDNNHFWTTGGNPAVDPDWQKNMTIGDPKLAGEPAIDWDGQSGATYYKDIKFSDLRPLAGSALIGSGKPLGVGFATEFLTQGTDFSTLPTSQDFVLSTQPVGAWDIGAFVHSTAAALAKGQIVSLTHPATVDHGAMCDINAAIKNIGELSGRFKTQILINSILLATSPEFTLAGGAISSDKIDPFKAPLSGESMDIIIKCIRSE